MQQPVDYGFVGAAYEAPDPFQDSQRLVNWYVEVSEDDKSKTPTALLGCPGLNTIIPLATAEQVRGCWVLPGSQTALVVAGDTVYLLTLTVPASPTSIAQFSNAVVGTLLTSSGQVCIRDNGAGGYGILVDGANGYYYRLSGAGSTAFTGTPTIGSVTLPYTGTLNPALIAGSVLSGPGIAPGATIVSVSSTLAQITMSLPATASPGPSVISVALASFGRIVDPAFLGADRVAFINGFLIFNQPGTQNFYTNAPIPYTLLFDGSFFAKNDSSSDNLVTLESNDTQLWLVGERHSEVWFNAGAAQFSFQRIPGASPQIGCAAKHSIVRVGAELMWLARNEQGENVVIKTSQYSFDFVTNPATSHSFARYLFVEDATAYAYQEDEHVFYVITFPTADKTWAYDLKTGKWHERASYDDALGQFHRHRGNCFMNLQNIRMVGDFLNGKIYQLSRSFYDDAGEPLVAVRRCGHIWSRESRQRLFFGSLQVEFAPGVGLSVGQGSDPQAMLRWSDDGGATFGTEHWTGIGKQGRFKNRAIWRRLGHARDRVFEVSISDPVRRDIVGCTLYAGASIGA